ILLTIAARGGWDVTSYCDPKENVKGEKKINYWANNDKIQRVGGISYAPIGNNDWFFQKYANRMLVINGIDAQTNSHDTGVVHSWTGRNTLGAPSITALFAAAKAPNLPMTYVGAGGFNSTAGLVPLSRINNTSQLKSLSNPNSVDWQSEPIRSFSSMSRIRALRQKRLDRMMARDDLMGRDRTNLEAFNKAVEGQSLLKTVSGKIENPSWDTTLRSRMDVALTAFQAGVSSAADVEADHDFDTHGNHDGRHHQALSDLNNDIDYLWTKAEELGIANRLTVVVSSDFGRTPHYNDQNGKDHWPIGSMIVMRKNASWTNRTVGMTDAGHNAMRVNPRSLQADNNNGTIIYPKHTHKALQGLLGIESFAQSAGWGINTDSFNFFA
ncbi:MAG: DUF1501 domain-containing protein, partial [SAR324 cluster bacterium]|nr:DUF1501 domain-containing protein [SAR324 cluster bacterium]